MSKYNVYTVTGNNESNIVFFAIGPVSLQNIIEKLVLGLDDQERITIELGHIILDEIELRAFVESAGGNLIDLHLPEPDEDDKTIYS